MRFGTDAVRLGAAIGSVWFLACGAGTQAASAPEPLSWQAEESTAPVDDGMVLEGTMGTLSTDEVRRGLDPRMARLERCVARGMAVVPEMSGRMVLAFRVAEDGTVLWVYPVASDVGDIVTESCVLEAARGSRFGPPHGGQAEFRWPFEFDALGTVPVPVSLAEADVQTAIAEPAAGLRALCALGYASVRVTAYVAPGGVVKSAGVATRLAQPAELPSDGIPRAGTQGPIPQASELQCVADRVRAWMFPDPAPSTAKIAFELP